MAGGFLDYLPPIPGLLRMRPISAGGDPDWQAYLEPIGRENIPMPGLNYSQGDVLMPAPLAPLGDFSGGSPYSSVYRGGAPPPISYPVSPYTDPTIYNQGNTGDARGFGRGEIGNANRSPIQEEGTNPPHPEVWWGSPPMNDTPGAVRPPRRSYGAPPTYEDLPPAPRGMQLISDVRSDPVTQATLQPPGLLQPAAPQGMPSPDEWRLLRQRQLAWEAQQRQQLSGLPEAVQRSILGQPSYGDTQNTPPSRPIATDVQREFDTHDPNAPAARNDQLETELFYNRIFPRYDMPLPEGARRPDLGAPPPMYPQPLDPRLRRGPFALY